MTTRDIRLLEAALEALHTVTNYLYKLSFINIRECAELVKDSYQEDEFTCYNAAEEIKDHFGVEE